MVGSFQIRFIMKNYTGKYQRSLDLLFTLHTLRQDCLLFTKILTYHDKRLKLAHLSALSDLENQRTVKESNLLQGFSTIQMNESWKGYLFGFCNKISKLVKNFQMKVIFVSSKWADTGETNSFLQKFRNQCIQTLSQCGTVGQFIKKVIDWLRKRYEQQVYIYTNNNSKFLDLIRKQPNNKVNRYLFLLQDSGPELFLESHQKALLKMDLQFQKILKSSVQQPHPMSELVTIMSLDNQTDFNEYILHSNLSIVFSYMEEGLCEFLVSKWQRIFKDYKQKNEHNQRIIDKFQERYINYNKKSKTSKQEKRQRSSTLSFNEQFTTQNNDYNQINNYFDIAIDHHSQHEVPHNKKFSILKVLNNTTRKRSNTLKPLEKENKQIFPQKIIQMKLADGSAPTVKNMRIRKRKAFPVLRDENSWSLLIRQNQQNPKLALYLH